MSGFRGGAAPGAVVRGDDGRGNEFALLMLLRWVVVVDGGGGSGGGGNGGFFKATAFEFSGFLGMEF